MQLRRMLRRLMAQQVNARARTTASVVRDERKPEVTCLGGTATAAKADAEECSMQGRGVEWL